MGRFWQIGCLSLGLLIFPPLGLSADCQHTPAEFRCVEFLSNYDGDTATFNIPGVHNLLGEKISIRVLHIDAPEIRGSSDCEKAAAKLAKQHLHDWLTTAQRIDLTNIQRDKYFRILADVMVDGQSVGEKLSELGLAYPYEGGTKVAVDWCPIASA